MSKSIYIMMGTSGSGKSTWIKNNVPDAVICSADHFFEDKFGNYNFQSNKLYQAHETAFSKYLRALDDESVTNIVVDNTNTRLKYMRRYAMEANLRGYPVTMVVLRVDPEVAAQRNKHGVPKETIDKMDKEIENTLTIGFPDTWDIKETIIIDNRSGK